MREDVNNPSPDSLVKSYGILVSSLCRRMIKNEEEAKDAAQEAWIEILRGLPEFRGDAKLSTWIYTVTYHTVLRYAERERIYSTRFLKDHFHGEQLNIPCDIDYDQKIWVKEMCDKCLTGIAHCLDNDSRIAYLFRDMVQLSYDDIAEIIDKEPTAVRKMVSRSRKKLKNFLRDECSLYNPHGSCQCRMKNLVTEIELPQEYLKLRKFIHQANVYLESTQILPQKNYWEKLIS